MIIQDLLKSRTNNFVSKNMSALFKLSNVPLPVPELAKSLVFPSQEFNINFTQNRIRKIINNEKMLVDYYNLSVTPDKLKTFYLYPNDYTNLNMLKMFDCLCIINENIKTFLKENGKIFYMDNQGSTPIHYLVKNYYSKSLDMIDGINTEFVRNNKIIKKSPLEYLIHEYKNHIDKFDGDIKNFENIKCYKDKEDLDNKTYYSMKHFTSNQYNQIKKMILSNDNYGNNLIKYLDTSFIMAQYFTQHYLTQYFIRFGDNREDSLKLMYGNADLKKEASKNEFIKNINTMNLPEKDSIFFKKEIIKSLDKELEIIDTIKPDKTRTKIQQFGKKFYLKMRIRRMKRRIKSITVSNLNIIDNNLNQHQVMKKYENLLENDFDKHHAVYIYAWDKFLKDENKNKNVLPNLCIQKEREILINLLKGDIKADDKDKLRKIHNIYKSWSEAGIHYYEGDKYLNNEQVNFSYRLLKHLTQNIICYNIELIMRKVLLQHLQKTYPNYDVDDYTKILDYMLGKNYHYNANNTNQERKLLSILYEDISEKIVKFNIPYFYKDENDRNKNLDNSESLSEILKSFFQLLSVSETYKISEDSTTMKILTGPVISYFDLFIDDFIKNTQVVIENQFRFVINQERILDCILKMM